MNQSMHRTYEEATLAGLPGEGYLERVATDGDERVREGCWKTEHGEEIYAELRAKYLARETMTYRDAQGNEAEVFIASWFGVGHPECLVIRTPEELE